MLEKIRTDHPSLIFTPGDTFRWSHTTRTITYNTRQKNYEALLLHELAHALLGHQEYSLDIELLQKEREAWHYAETVLAQKYHTAIPSDAKEDALDTYRSWLHKRSLCPECNTTTPQTQTGTYTCVVCGCQWRANKAVECDLRRYRVSPTRLS